MLQRSRSMLEHLLGLPANELPAELEVRDDDPEVPIEVWMILANTLSGLGTLARLEGRFAEAEQPLKDAICLNEKIFGPDHPAVATH